MAGRKQADRTEDVAAKAAAPDAIPEPPAVDLVPMHKDGEEVDVHPTCVQSHLAVGWRLKA